MPLAAIVGIWVLLATPSVGGAWGGSAPVMQSSQDSQTAPPQQQEAPPNSQSKPATEPSAQQNAPTAGEQETAKPPGGQPSQTEPPKASPPAQEPVPESVQPSPSPEQPKTSEPKNGPTKAGNKPISKPSTSKVVTSKTSASKTRKRRKRKPVSHSPASSTPAKTVVRNGSTSEPTVQISPSLSQQQASNQLQNTSQLLASTDANLKKVAAQQLSASQQDTAKQIRQYMQQANTAVAAGDLERGHNLAVKAHLLSEELVKH